MIAADYLHIDAGHIWATTTLRIIVISVSASGVRFKSNIHPEQTMPRESFGSWLQAIKATLQEPSASDEKRAAIQQLETLLRVLFPYADPADDPDRERAEDQVRAYQALRLLS